MHVSPGKDLSGGCGGIGDNRRSGDVGKSGHEGEAWDALLQL